MHQIQLLKKYPVQADKSKGQNFLIDENIQRKIIQCLAPQAGECVLEIGAGLGALTDWVLDTGARVTAVEKDSRFYEILKEELKSYENLELVLGDILEFDFSAFAEKCRGGKGPLKVVSNLPYYISTDILFYLIKHRADISLAVLMMQQEFADRLVARPSTKAYGRLTLAVQFYADVVSEFKVARGCFTPRPQVGSVVLSLRFHGRTVPGLDVDLMFNVIRASFATRRKHILNNLSAGPFELTREEWEAILTERGIEHRKRAEELHLKDYIDLTLHIQQFLKDKK